MVAQYKFKKSLILQLIVVVTPDWDAVEGTLYCYERTLSDLQWKLVGSYIDVELGKKGMAPGRGVLQLEEQWGMHKKEGDMKSPAGIFVLGPAFGDEAHQHYALNMPFRLITDDLEYVDDPNSLYYNQFVTAENKCDRVLAAGPGSLDCGSGKLSCLAEQSLPEKNRPLLGG